MTSGCMRSFWPLLAETENQKIAEKENHRNGRGWKMQLFQELIRKGYRAGLEKVDPSRALTIIYPPKLTKRMLLGMNHEPSLPFCLAGLVVGSCVSCAGTTSG